MSIRSRILDAAVTLADRLEDASALRAIGGLCDAAITGRIDAVGRMEPKGAFDYALGCTGIAAALAIRLAAKGLGRPSFSPLMAWAQGLDDDDLRDGSPMGDA
jgi:hypothetical protein